MAKLKNIALYQSWYLFERNAPFFEVGVVVSMHAPCLHIQHNIITAALQRLLAPVRKLRLSVCRTLRRRIMRCGAACAGSRDWKPAALQQPRYFVYCCGRFFMIKKEIHHPYNDL
jgi:hypothetical protein